MAAGRPAGCRAHGSRLREPSWGRATDPASTASTASHRYADEAAELITTTPHRMAAAPKAVSRRSAGSFPARIPPAGSGSGRSPDPDSPPGRQQVSRLGHPRATSSTSRPNTTHKRLCCQQQRLGALQLDLSREGRADTRGHHQAAAGASGRERWKHLARSSRLHRLRSGRARPAWPAADLALIGGEFALGGDRRHSRSSTSTSASQFSGPAERSGAGQPTGRQTAADRLRRISPSSDDAARWEVDENKGRATLSIPGRRTPAA